MIAPFFWLKEMTEQPITRTKAWLESLRPKHYPWLSPLSSSAPRWRGSKAASIRWSRCWRLLPPVCCKFYLISPMIMATPSKAAINLTVSGRCAECKKGAITQSQMKRALIVTVALICLSGLALLFSAWQTMADFIGFMVLGGLSIIAAITYTVGTRPYGYIGLGDISVLVFFGWLSVVGSWYLQAHSIEAVIFLPATACGLLAAAVLNINNLRDIDSDRLNGKTRWRFVWGR
jgi:1,4-dihydroxy-2-naphtoate prenyltransferase (EC 2.5.1.-)